MDDRPPDVRILRPAADQQITPLEEVAIEARAEDDYGISALRAGLCRRPGASRRSCRSNAATGSDVRRSATHTLAAEDLGVQPGDVITYYARARDVGRGKRPTETTSDMFFLEVRPFNEEFVLAQSQAMSGMASEQIETLIAAQKEIINATWNIERRAASGAGRSADDMKAIAEAQAELQGRAEQMPRRTDAAGARFRFPQQFVPLVRRGQQAGAARPPSDPVGAAIVGDGAGRSSSSKGSGRARRCRTRWPRSRACCRRRPKSGAARWRSRPGASMGGLGRQGQDLSALFDKELQRQQRTNYETRSQAETRPDRQESDSALDRIRDLARRQEELSRRQRELAAGGPDRPRS